MFHGYFLLGFNTVSIRQLRFNYRVSYKTYEKSAVILMSVVSGFFLAYNVLGIRCGILFIFYFGCPDSRYKITVLVINSAVNPLAYAFFKRDIKKELMRLMPEQAGYKWQKNKVAPNI